MTTILVAGTDTDVGKTWVTTALLAYLLKSRPRESFGVMKLMQTGIGDDEHYQSLFQENPRIETVTPLRFAAPLAPPLAAAKEGKTVNLDQVKQALVNLQQKYSLVIVEGLGGLGSPVTDHLTIGEVAGQWQLNTILVVPIKLGAIAHTVANVHYAHYCQIKLNGIILNSFQPISEEKLEDWTPIKMIESFTQTPVCGVLSYNERVNLDKMADIASHWKIETLLNPF
jgi:dethiobiotin synthetase